jgi:hypothetical protein
MPYVCILCNGCIRKDSNSHCPYCGDYLASLDKNLKIWILSEAVAILASSSEDSYKKKNTSTSRS